jgi:recombination protein RecA
MFGEGICRLGCMLDVSEAVGVVLKKGSWYSFGETRLGQGRDRVVQYLREFPAVADEIEKAVRERLADELLLRSSKNGAAFVTPGLDEEILSEESLGDID